MAIGLLYFEMLFQNMCYTYLSFHYLCISKFYLMYSKYIFVGCPTRKKLSEVGKSNDTKNDKNAKSSNSLCNA